MAALDQLGHWGEGSTEDGADRKGPLKGVAAPMVSTSPGYEISGSKGAFHSSNVVQGLQVTYSSAGFDLRVEKENTTCTASFSLIGIGRGDVELVPGKAVAAIAEGGRLEVDHGAFQMLYENDQRGMRHDLVVLQEPQGNGPLEARLRLSGDLLAVQTTPDEVVFNAYDAHSRGLSPVLRYNGLHAWDAEGRVLSSRMELRGDVLVLAVQDEDAVYPVTIDPISSTADLELLGGQPGETFGYSVATAGDVNGDGYSDIIVGAPSWDLPFTDAGRAMIFLGSATGIASTPAWTVQGTGANAQFGFSISSAGDVNGDGISDVVIGAPGYNGHGAAFVYLGAAPSGPGMTAAAVWTGNAQAASKFGYAVALAGDVNGDGYSDVLVGAPLFDVPPSGTDQGRAYCYHGNTLALVWTANGTAPNVQFGFSVAGAGDLNGDGLSDVAIGAPFQAKSPAINNGAVYVYKGNNGSGLSVTANGLRIGGGSANLGFSLSSAGDMNGDGYADLIIGAPGVAGGNGAAYVYLGTGVGPDLIAVSGVTVAGVSGERLGQSVSLAGDVNGDGYSDIIIGSPNTGTDKGKVRIYRGGPVVALDAAHLYWTRTGTIAGAYLGTAVATCGDVNGDGISEVLIGAPGQAGTGVVSIYHGKPDLPATAPAWSVVGGVVNGELGREVASAGDVNGDGYADVLVGAPGLDGRKGRVMLYLGSSSGLSTTPTWTAFGENALDQFGLSVASAGDVNGDGYSDVLVGAPSYPASSWRGKAYLYLGGPGGLGASPAWTRLGENVDDRLGWSVASAGDVNGDGFSDVVVGAYMFGTSVANEHGKAYVFHGSLAGLGATPTWTDEGTPQSFYAASVSLAGDVNGDGYDDLIVGAPFHDLPAGNNYGAAFLYLGSSVGLAPTAAWTKFGEVAGDEFGISVSMAGDVNGDGYSDVVIGAYRHNIPGSTQAGRAYVFHGEPTVSGLGGTANTVIDGLLEGENLGISVCSAGDVNGDGFSDVVIGSPNASFFYPQQGRIAVHLGSAGGVPAIPDLSIYGPGAANARMGNSVALAGDVNGDGYSDLVAGAYDHGPSFSREGVAFLYLGGAPGMAMRTYQYKSNLTSQVRTSNGTFEAACDWGIGQFARSSLGRSKVKLAWEYIGHGPGVPAGVLMPNKSTAFTGQSAGWTDSGLSGVLVKQALNGPTGSGHPAWRARVRQHPATALDGRMFGRWFVQGVHDLQVPSIKTNLVVCGPLPVTLVSSSTTCQNGSAVLEWTTASEQDCANFIVQRSRDGEQWETIGQVPCSGNSSTFLRYSYTDRASVTGAVTYYRLDQYDINGTVAHYPAMVLTPCADMMALVAWPNPFQDELFIDMNTTTRGDEMILATVRDLTGRVVVERTVELSLGSIGRVGGLSGLPQGPYVIELRSTIRGRLGQVRAIRM